MAALIVVSGRPGSGRTRVGRMLADAFGVAALDARTVSNVFDDEAPAPVYGPGLRSHLAVLHCAQLARGGAVVDAPFAPDVFTSNLWGSIAAPIRRVHLLCDADTAAARLAVRPDVGRQHILDDFDAHAHYWDEVDASSDVTIVAANSFGVADTADLVARLCADWGAPPRR